MKIRNGHLTIASITSAILCPLPYILLLDEYSRESEFAPQILGFAFASIGVFVYCAFFFSALLFCCFSLKNHGQWIVDKKWAKKVLLLGIVDFAVYMVIGFGKFRGLDTENTVFYLISRFAPYFISMVFCFLASVFSLSNVCCIGKIQTKWILACLPLIIVLAEKIYLGRVSDIDMLFGIAYVVAFLIFSKKRP